MIILIVEDNPVSARILELYLHKHGYQTIVASNGRHALECLTSMPEIQLVISDIVMPEMDGLELFSKMKEIPNWEETPFIFCTSLADVGTVKRAAKMGCKHYLIKPVNEGQVLQKVREAMEYEKPVLRSKDQVMSQLGLDSRSYDEAAKAFAAHVSDKIALLEQQVEGATPIGITDLLNLSEGAALLGAEGVNSTLNKLVTKGDQIEPETKNSAYLLLLTELKTLQHVLPYQPQEDSREVCAESESKKTEESYFSVDGDIQRLALPEKFTVEIAAKVERLLESKVKGMVNSGVSKLILDLSKVTAANISLIRLIVVTIKKCRESNIRAQVAGTPALADEIKGFKETLELQIHHEVQDAKSAL